MFELNVRKIRGIWIVLVWVGQIVVGEEFCSGLGGELGELLNRVFLIFSVCSFCEIKMLIVCFCLCVLTCLFLKMMVQVSFFIVSQEKVRRFEGRFGISFFFLQFQRWRFFCRFYLVRFIVVQWIFIDVYIKQGMCGWQGQFCFCVGVGREKQ